MLPGIQGTWEETGISCEQCHTDPNVSAPDVGGGAKHVSSQLAADITVDSSNELCGSCHNRGLDPDTNIPASGDLPNTFIRHHEQYNEWRNSAHGDDDGNKIGCNDCHNPHIGTRYGFADDGGITQTCEGCHPGPTANNKHIDVSGFGDTLDCETCHMAQATKSGALDPLGNPLYVGDVKTHIFKINPAAEGKDVFFDFSGDLARGWRRLRTASPSTSCATSVTRTRKSTATAAPRSWQTLDGPIGPKRQASTTRPEHSIAGVAFNHSC